MKLVKIEDGLLEYENFFTTSPSEDFLGENQYSRTSNVFILKEGYVERPFTYNEFVIVVEKEGVEIKEGDSFKFYTRMKHQVAGIEETVCMGDSPMQSYKYWKLIRHSSFIQGYVSDDGVNWLNQGGGESFPNELQGLSVEGEAELKIKDYKVYRNPFLRIYNFPENTFAELVDSFGEVLYEQYADENELIEFFLKSPINAKVRFYDEGKNFLYETEIMYFQYGDVFVKKSKDIELIYKGVVVDYNPTMLHALTERMILKNTSSTETYNDLFVQIINPTIDDIKISLDSLNYDSNVIINTLAPQEEVEMFVRILKNRSSTTYGTRQFYLEID